MSNMTSTSTHDLNAHILAALETQRLDFWSTHSHWTESTLRKTWAQRTANLAGVIKDSDSGLAGSGEQERLALDTSATWNWATQTGNAVPSVAMSRSSTDSLSSTSSTRQPSTHGKRPHRQLDTADSTPPDYGAASWTGIGIQPHHRRRSQPVTVYTPAAFVSKLDCSSDLSPIATKRQRVEGHNELCHPLSHATHAYNVSPSTSSSSNLSPLSLIASDNAMSRQSSMTTSTSLVDGVDMMRFDSSRSNCSDNLQFSFDDDMGASLLSCTTEKPSNSYAATAFDDAAASQLFSGIDYGFVGQQDFSFRSSVGMNHVQGFEQNHSMFMHVGQDMQRSLSDQSVTTSNDLKAIERRRKHLENGGRPIASKTPPAAAPKSAEKARLLRPQEPGTQRKEPIAKASYQRPQHAKLQCDLCDERPNGFRGEHELRRHHDRVHKHQRRVWICIDPNNSTTEGWRPQRPLGICKQCNQEKHYNVYYNAAAHLRRAHFCPRKRGRKARGEKRESRAGKAGGDWPPIDWLKANGWLKEVEVTASDSEDGFVDSTMDSTVDNAEVDDDAFDDEQPAYMASQYVDPGLDAIHDSFSAEMLGMACPMPAADFRYGYPTPAMDFAIPFNNGYLADVPQAPPMEHTVSAPPVLDGRMMYGSSSFSAGFY